MAAAKASPCAWSGPRDNADFIRHCREQAGWCRELGSRFTAELCEAFATDAEQGGIVARLAATIDPPHRKRATSLRLAGALHHAALTGADSVLAETYPASDPNWRMEHTWTAAQAYLEREFDVAAGFIQSDPQTNETRRSIALLPGFLGIARRFDLPLNLLELGASAGLNQFWDRFSYSTETWQRAGRPPSDVTVNTKWRGRRPASDVNIEISNRRACDLNPIDLSDPAARLQLKSYTWPDQPERLSRLDAAMALAVGAGVQVDRSDAAEWLEQHLANRPEGQVTVVFHSVFLHYPPAEVRERIISTISRAGEGASEAAPVAWLCMEPDSVFERDNPKLGEFRVQLQTWPNGEARRIATTDGHVTYVKMSD